MKSVDAAIENKDCKGALRNSVHGRVGVVSCTGCLFVSKFGFSQQEKQVCYLMIQSLQKMCNHRTTDEWEMLHDGPQYRRNCSPCIRYE